jgi:hypothetical protein
MASLPREVERAIRKQSGRYIQQSYEKQITARFNTIKRRMISEFLNHPVTKEIAGGASATNISGTLGGYGNLFSYIGFYDGDDPISAVLQLFEKTTIQFGGLIDNGAQWNIFMPAREDIWEASPMPWAAGRSWAKGIETGISGVGQYLYDQRLKTANSRSGTAIQSEGKIRGKSRFKNVKYISAILAKYEKEFSTLDETAIPA